MFDYSITQMRPCMTAIQGEVKLNWGHYLGNPMFTLRMLGMGRENNVCNQVSHKPRGALNRTLISGYGDDQPKLVFKAAVHTKDTKSWTVDSIEWGHSVLDCCNHNLVVRCPWKWTSWEVCPLDVAMHTRTQTDICRSGPTYNNPIAHKTISLTTPSH